MYCLCSLCLDHIIIILVVVGPTHVHHQSSTIDLLWIIVELNRKPEKAAKVKSQLIWMRYSYADWNTARQLIDTFNWDSIMSDDIEPSWKQWHQEFKRYPVGFYPQEETFHG